MPAKAKKKVPPPAKRKDTLNEKEIASQQRFLAKSLSNPEISDNMLQCMDPSQGHAWEITNDLHVTPQSTEGRATTHIARDYQCSRCSMTKHERYIITKRGGVERLERLGALQYGRPDGYHMPGVPRGVRPAEIVRAEQYHRALDKALRTTRSQHLRSAK